MKDFAKSRRGFLKTTSALAGAFLLAPRGILARTEEPIQPGEPASPPSGSAVADYTLRIETSPVEIAPKRIISIATYNGQFPGPLLRFKVIGKLIAAAISSFRLHYLQSSIR